jgi:hypothetical protein
MCCLDDFGSFEMPGLHQIFVREQQHKIPVLHDIIECETDKLSHGGHRIERTKIQCVLLRANVHIDILKNSEIEIVLAAKVVIDQLLVDLRRLGDLVDAASMQAAASEFFLGNFQQYFPGCGIFTRFRSRSGPADGFRFAAFSAALAAFAFACSLHLIFSHGGLPVRC